MEDKEKIIREMKYLLQDIPDHSEKEWLIPAVVSHITNITGISVVYIDSIVRQNWKTREVKVIEKLKAAQLNAYGIKRSAYDIVEELTTEDLEQVFINILETLIQEKVITE